LSTSLSRAWPSAKAGKVTGSYLLFAMLGLLFSLSLSQPSKGDKRRRHTQVQALCLVASRGETLAAGGLRLAEPRRVCLRFLL